MSRTWTYLTLPCDTERALAIATDAGTTTVRLEQLLGGASGIIKVIEADLDERAIAELLELLTAHPVGAATTR